MLLVQWHATVLVHQHSAQPGSTPEGTHSRWCVSSNDFCGNTQFEWQLPQRLTVLRVTSREFGQLAHQQSALAVENHQMGCSQQAQTALCGEGVGGGP